MTLRSHLRNEPSLITFLKNRRLIRKAFETRQRYERERNQYRRIAVKLSAGGNLFDRHRISKFQEMQEGCTRDILEIESILYPLIDETYKSMASLSEHMKPAELASLAGVTTAWLDDKNADWAKMGLLQLYFGMMCEARTLRDKDHHAMFWFCGLMASKSQLIHDEIMASEGRDEDSSRAKPALKLVR
ncbi:hypothetical protein [Pseudomonas putida]|uniref:Uncharacterized protein n=1 Tax=Pseudomonas putida TaxID=303 RepID=A0A8I1EB97_PSEPU|nr:hypothetical protein [Pseudomonas putida]MBI6882837.1 hypothetical protein [Pseudomonas putida]